MCGLQTSETDPSGDYVVITSGCIKWQKWGYCSTDRFFRAQLNHYIVKKKAEKTMIISYHRDGIRPTVQLVCPLLPTSFMEACVNHSLGPVPSPSSRPQLYSLFTLMGFEQSQWNSRKPGILPGFLMLDHPALSVGRWPWKRRGAWVFYLEH